MAGPTRATKIWTDLTWVKKIWLRPITKFSTYLKLNTHFSKNRVNGNIFRKFWNPQVVWIYMNKFLGKFWTQKLCEYISIKSLVRVSVLFTRFTDLLCCVCMFRSGNVKVLTYETTHSNFVWHAKSILVCCNPTENKTHECHNLVVTTCVFSFFQLSCIYYT